MVAVSATKLGVSDSDSEFKAAAVWSGSGESKSAAISKFGPVLLFPESKEADSV
jgi:hypothetical protein